MKRLFLTITVAATFAAGLFAQEFRGTLGGTVTDPTGAAIAGARITVNEIHTSTKTRGVSDASGQYNVAFLLAGDYDVTVQMDGFKEAIRKGIHLGAGEHPDIEIRLEVGDARQTVEVTEEAPLINSENSSVGAAITTREVEDLPSNGGTPTAMVFWAPGVVLTTQPNQMLPFASGGAASFSMGGMPNQQNEILVDGVPDTTWDGRLAYSPPKVAVQEVRAKVFDTDAAYGRTAGGTANTILKSGSNDLHLSMAYFNQPSNMVANDFFRNKAGLPATLTHYNQGGLSASGPLVLPKVFNGRNKVFWMFAFEDIQDSTPATSFWSVPSAAEKTGDFSELLALRSPLTPITIYDPNTAVLTAGTTAYTRTPYPNNKIPASQLNPITQKYLAFIPAPNVTTGRADGYQNFGNNSPTTDGFTNELGRLDFNLGYKNRTYFNVRHTDYFQNKNDYFGNITTGSNLSRNNWGASLDHVFIADANDVVNIRMNFTRMFEDHSAPSAGFDPTALGFPSYILANSLYQQLPVMSFSGNTSFVALGSSGANKLPSQSLQMFISWARNQGNHAIKVGFDARQYRLNYLAAGNSTGSYSFSANNWVRASSSASSTVVQGQDFASFLLGLPTGGSYDINTSGMFYQYYTSGFVQDDWRPTRTLTLNIGLRFDHDNPYHEKWGRSTNGFDFNTPSPLAAAAKAAYAAAPSPLLPVNAFNVLGGLTFASPSENALFHAPSLMVSPRVGFAWSPSTMHGKTVIRGGFGMYTAPFVLAQLSPSNGKYSTNPLLAQEGFSQSTSMTVTSDNYLTPSSTLLSNPYPGGINKPAGSTVGLGTFAGQSVFFFNPEMKSPYSLRWSFDLQRQLTPTVMLDIQYLGGHSIHVPIAYTQLNGIPAQSMSTMPIRDTALNTAMSATIANPFAGLATATSATKTVATSALLAKYPQFPVYTGGIVTSGTSGVVEYNLDEGNNHSNAINVSIIKRFSKGLQLSASYMKSRVMDQNTWLNAQDPQPERRVSPFDHPNVIKASWVYQLPIGRNQALRTRSRWLDTAVGGWKLSGTYTRQTGQAIGWSNGDYVYFGGDLDVHPRNVNGTAFNTGAFDTLAADQFAYHLRTFSSTFSSARTDGVNQLDLSVMKVFKPTERWSAELRCDAFNAINHPTFDTPNVTPTAAGFGTITAQLNKSRVLQLGAKINF